MTQHDNQSHHTSRPSSSQSIDDQQSTPADAQQAHNQTQPDDEKKPTSYWKLFLYGMGGIVVIELIQALMR